MLLKYFYDSALAHASYMVGCQKTGEAVIIDAGRDIQQYLDAAAAEDLGRVLPQLERAAIEPGEIGGRRRLVHDAGQVSVEQAALADEVFSSLMGEDVESRKAFIQSNARDVRFLDI